MPYKDPELQREWKRRWYHEHKEQCLARKKRYRAAHLEECRAYSREWSKKNPEKRAVAAKRKRAKAALKALEAAKAQPKAPSPAVLRLLALAEAKATQARYGIERVAYA